MNYSHSHDNESIGTRMKALAFVFIVGSVALTANRVIVAPAESSMSGTSLHAVSDVAVMTAASAAVLYPALAADAAQDENGHPPSF